MTFFNFIADIGLRLMESVWLKAFVFGLGSLTAIVLSIFWVCGMVKVIFYERRIKSLRKQKRSDIKDQEGQGRGIPLSIVKGKQARIASRYDAMIEELELKRRFVLDKLPFLKR